ncbi:hypothetical protein JK358_23320 [Nocardia sp. 2]|uniref:Uncharacterized protein n=1 Tax=Nocardia acididurans TaxID=2802282 RepID=A0ABS1M9U6_9NOCA|nr:hypothetical protein [Nocardia acididurans]MBL1077336.1 hypothetical protein [Nocardia acididurans]
MLLLEIRAAAGRHPAGQGRGLGYCWSADLMSPAWAVHGIGQEFADPVTGMFPGSPMLSATNLTAVLNPDSKLSGRIRLEIQDRF